MATYSDVLIPDNDLSKPRLFQQLIVISTA